MTPRYSILQIARNALTGHRNWPQAWRSPDPRPEYDVVIIGGGGHGLATAYYLAKRHGIRDVCVVEKGWLGGGNTGRNTTNIRSNYLQPESAALYDDALSMWERLSAELNYNVMFSQRGWLTLGHSIHEMQVLARHAHAMRLAAIETALLDREGVKKRVPILDCSPDAVHPVLGGLWQARGGTARHDAVAWGYARAADALGVDIIQNCEVTGLTVERGRITGVETSRGPIKAKKVGAVVAGHASVVAEMAGLRLPIVSSPLQAMVSEPVKPVLDTVVLSNTVHVYVNQSDKGELVFGSASDTHVSYSQRGAFSIVEETATALCELFPIFRRLRMLRQWGGIVDVTPDRSPIISRTPVEGFYLNCGWGTGGFKATPASGKVFAQTIANDEPHPLAAPFSLDRFRSGVLIDEAAAASVAH